MLDISKSGLLLGMVDGYNGEAGRAAMEAENQADDVLESGSLAPSDDSGKEHVWARALRLTRCAV